MNDDHTEWPDQMSEIREAHDQEAMARRVKARPPEPIAAEAVLTARLEAREWNIVLDALQNAPYRLVAPIIERLHRQLASRE